MMAGCAWVVGGGAGASRCSVPESAPPPPRRPSPYNAAMYARLLVLALCLARLQRDTLLAPTPPVILSVDVLGELDDTRRRAFWNEVGEKHQVIATGTVPPPSGEWLTYRVSGGRYLQA